MKVINNGVKSMNDFKTMEWVVANGPLSEIAILLNIKALKAEKQWNVGMDYIKTRHGKIKYTPVGVAKMLNYVTTTTPEMDEDER